jgi:hypothetical protein
MRLRDGLAACGLALVLGACSGSITAGEGAGPADPSPPSGGPSAGLGSSDNGAPQPMATAPGSDAGSAVPVFVAAPAAMRRLTTIQYQNSIRTLLGDIDVSTELEADTAVNGFVAIGAAHATISPSAAEKYETSAFEIAKQALSADRREALVGCKPSGVSDATCTRAFITRFGRRAWRRPLTADEVSRYASVADNAATTLNDFWSGIEFALAGLLQSPNFLFRIELGVPNASGTSGSLHYDDYEMATRLSFLFWNTTPDDTLLDAASAGELVALSGLTAQVERLISDPRAHEAMNNFHAERLGLEGLSTLSKDPKVFPAMSDTLGAAMRADLLQTIEYVTLGAAGDYRDLFDTRVGFVDAELAKLYGVTAPSSSGTAAQRVELPADSPRVGLLTKAGLLALNAHVQETSPTLRGKFVRERILCQSIPAPPANVVPILPEPDPNAPTMRARLATHRSVASCAGCHNLMDPIGLTFEHFDAIGAYRVDDDGHALDTNGDLDGQMFADPSQLARILHDDPAAVQCVVRQLYRYAVAHVETDGEQSVVDTLAKGFAGSGYKLTDLLQAVVMSDGFRQAGRE